MSTSNRRTRLEAANRSNSLDSPAEQRVRNRIPVNTVLRRLKPTAGIMTTQRDSMSRWDDTQLRIVSHRLEVTGGTANPGGARLGRNNGAAKSAAGAAPERRTQL